MKPHGRVPARPQSGERDPKTTQVHDRFHVSDGCCGLHETAMKLNDALAIAESHARRHAQEGDHSIECVYVYDTMAHVDQPREWRIPVLTTRAALSNPATEPEREAKRK